MLTLLRRIAVNPNNQIAAGLMWSFSAVIVKALTTNTNLDIFAISAVRSLIGIVFLLPLFFLNRNEATSSHNSMKSGSRAIRASAIKLLGGTALAANSFLLCWAFQHTSALTPVFMHYSGLLLVAPASLAVLHYFPTQREWFAGALTVCGLVALVFHGLAFDKPIVVAVSLGVGLTQFLGQLCIAWLSKDDEAAFKNEGKRQNNAGQCFLICEGLTITLGLALAHRGAFSGLSATSVLQLLLLGTLTWGLPNLLALIAVRTKAIVSLSLLWLADPIFVSFWPVAFGQDAPPPPLAWLGGLLILAALVIQRTGQRSAPEPAV